jgi:hypothetical protein
MFKKIKIAFGFFCRILYIKNDKRIYETSASTFLVRPERITGRREVSQRKLPAGLLPTRTWTSMVYPWYVNYGM